MNCVAYGLRLEMIKFHFNRLEEAMSFESSMGETERRSNSDKASTEGDSIWRMKHMKETVKDFVQGVKQTSPREAVRNITEAADQAKNQAKDYVEHTTVRGVVDDVAELIKRHPIQALMVGMAAGFLFSRKRGG